jgi:hypothetical protein
LGVVSMGQVGLALDSADVFSSVVSGMLPSFFGMNVINATQE